MRNIINISLPLPMAKQVEQYVNRGHFASTSEFFRHLVRLYNNQQLGNELAADRKDFAAGKGLLLQSLADLD